MNCLKKYFTSEKDFANLLMNNDDQAWECFYKIWHLRWHKYLIANNNIHNAEDRHDIIQSFLTHLQNKKDKVFLGVVEKNYHLQSVIWRVFKNYFIDWIRKENRRQEKLLEDRSIDLESRKANSLYNATPSAEDDLLKEQEVAGIYLGQHWIYKRYEHLLDAIRSIPWPQRKNGAPLLPTLLLSERLHLYLRLNKTFQFEEFPFEFSLSSFIQQILPWTPLEKKSLFFFQSSITLEDIWQFLIPKIERREFSTCQEATALMEQLFNDFNISLKHWGKWKERARGKVIDNLKKQYSKEKIKELLFTWEGTLK